MERLRVVWKEKKDERKYVDWQTYQHEINVASTQYETGSDAHWV
jgi:hypothetical protein